MGVKMVSIILPIYNKEKELEQCLKSILSQKYKNIEVYIPSNKANMVTLLGVSFNLKRNLAPSSIIGFTYFIACVYNILPPNFIYYSLSFC